MALKIFLTGWAVLLAAIVLNIIANQWEITTWYPFLSNVQKYGFTKTFLRISLISKVFLFVIYPLMLGVVAFFTLRNIK